MKVSETFSAMPDCELFRLAFSHASIGMALVGKDGTWLDVNKSVCLITGYSREELLSTTFQEITHPNDLEKDLNLLRRMLDGEIEQYEMEKRYFHKQGHVVWILLTVSTVRDSNRQPHFFIAQIQDITERISLREEVLQKKSEIETILKNTASVIARFDRNRRHLYVNAGVEKELGMSAEAVTGKTIGELGIRDKTSELIESAIERVFDENQTVEIEYENLLSPEPRHFIARFSPEFNKYGDTETVLMVSTNITDLKNTEFKLRHALAEIKQLREILPICSYCKHIRDDKDYWHSVENYITAHTDSKFSHSICPHCYESQIKPQLEVLRKERI